MPEAGTTSGAEAPPSASAPSPSPTTATSPASAKPTANAPTRTAYSPQLDGLRAVAVLMVFLHHAYTVSLLWAGVDLFFILSGYLITNILLRDSGRMRLGPMLRLFYLRRAQRILPAYLLCLALIAAFIRVDWHRLWPFYAFFLQNIPYAFRWTGFSPLIPLWSLAVEQHFYLVWPFLVYFMPRRWLTPTLVAVLAGTPILRAVCTPLFAFPEPIYALTPFRLDAMAAGALAALWLPRCPPRKALLLARCSIVLGIVAFAFLGLHPWFRRGANTPQFNGLAYSLNILVLGGLFVWTLLAQPKSWLVRLLASAPMRGLGRISYGFYLFHLLVLMLLGPLLPTKVGPPAAFACTVLLATGSWFLLEKPILALGYGHRGAAGKSSALPA